MCTLTPMATYWSSYFSIFLSTYRCRLSCIIWFASLRLLPPWGTPASPIYPGTPCVLLPSIAPHCLSFGHPQDLQDLVDLSLHRSLHLVWTGLTRYHDKWGWFHLFWIFSNTSFPAFSQCLCTSLCIASVNVIVRVLSRTVWVTLWRMPHLRYPSDELQRDFHVISYFSCALHQCHVSHLLWIIVIMLKSLCDGLRWPEVFVTAHFI